MLEVVIQREKVRMRLTTAHKVNQCTWPWIVIQSIFIFSPYSLCFSTSFSFDISASNLLISKRYKQIIKQYVKKKWWKFFVWGVSHEVANWIFNTWLGNGSKQAGSFCDRVLYSDQRFVLPLTYCVQAIQLSLILLESWVCILLYRIKELCATSYF